MLNLPNLVNQFQIPPWAIETVSGFPLVTTYYWQVLPEMSSLRRIRSVGPSYSLLAFSVEMALALFFL